MTHPLSPFVRAVLEKAANKMNPVLRSMTSRGDAYNAIRALDADQIAAENAHLVPGAQSE